MKTKVKLIGRYQDIVGEKEITIQPNSNSTIGDIVNLVVQKYPDLEKNKKFMIVSVNNIFSNHKTRINEGDIVTISPPIVGGG